MLNILWCIKVKSVYSKLTACYIALYINKAEKTNKKKRQLNSQWTHEKVFHLTGSSVQSRSHIQLFATPWTAGHQVSQSITNSQSLSKLMSIELVMPSNQLILCHPLLLLPSIFPSIRVFSNELALCIKWPKYWSFNFTISTSNEHDEMVGSPCSPRDSQESSPTPQFKRINSSALSFLYSPTLTSIHDSWKNHSPN